MNISYDKLFTNCSKRMQDVQLHQQLAAASFGGAISAIITCPFDVVKTRLQIAPAVTNNTRMTQQALSGTWDTFAKIIRNEGVLTLWRGLSPSLIMTVPNAAIYFNTYEALKNQITKIQFPYPQLIPLVSGALARVVAVTTLAPLELIRTNFQAQQRDRSVLSFVRKTGLRGLWLGVGATLSRDVPFSAVYWSCYEYFKSRIKQNIKQTTYGAFITSFLSGCFSGMFSAILTTPIDLVKTRVQTGAHTHKSLTTRVTARDIMWQIYRQEGVKGFTRGWIPRAVKVGPACAIMISSYEFIRSIGHKAEITSAGG